MAVLSQKKVTKRMRNKRVPISETVSGSSNVVGGGGGVGGSWLDKYFTYDETNKALVLSNPDGGNEITFANDDGDIMAYSDSAGTLPSFWDGMPIASSTQLGGVKVGANLTIDGNGVLSASGGAPDQTLSFSNPNLSISAGNTVDLSGLTPDLSGYYTSTQVDAWRNGTTQTEMGYIHGVTSDIQTQLNAKADTSTLSGYATLDTTQTITGQKNFTQKVGINKTNPSRQLHVAAGSGVSAIIGQIYSGAVTSNTTNYWKAIEAYASTGYNIASSITDSGYRLGFDVTMFEAAGNLKGTLNSQYGIRIQYGILDSGSTGTINTVYGLKLEHFANAGTQSNVYSIYSGSSTARLYHKGKVGINVGNPSEQFEVGGNIKSTGEITAYAT